MIPPCFQVIVQQSMYAILNLLPERWWPGDPSAELEDLKPTPGQTLEYQSGVKPGGVRPISGDRVRRVMTRRIDLLPQSNSRQKASLLHRRGVNALRRCTKCLRDPRRCAWPHDANTGSVSIVVICRRAASAQREEVVV